MALLLSAALALVFELVLVAEGWGAHILDVSGSEVGLPDRFGRD
jgi:hypothetical protein